MVYRDAEELLLKPLTAGRGPNGDARDKTNESEHTASPQYGACVPLWLSVVHSGCHFDEITISDEWG